MTVTLSDLFELHARRRWFFLKPGGNWGDQLIYSGAEILAKRKGLEWVDISADELDTTPFQEGDAIYLHGGGGFNSWCSGTPFVNFASAIGKKVHLVVQGPQSTQDDMGFLRERLGTTRNTIACEEVFFFGREEVSFRNLRGVFEDVPRLTVAIDHDTAFHLSREDVLGLAGGLDRVPEGRYFLNIRRRDQERLGEPPARSFFSIQMDPAYFARSFEHWLRLHIYAKGVNTDRLHSGIAAAIVGKEVTLLPGSYHKNRSVFEYSLQEMGVRWQDHLPGTPPPARPTFMDRLRGSYKLRRLKYFLAGVPS